jgi:MFS family permease
MTRQVQSPNNAAPVRSAGAAQGIIIAVAAFFPIMAIVSLAPAVPRILQHFEGSPHARVLVPLMVTAPGIMVTLFSPLAGWFTDRLGRRRILLAATSIYGFLGVAPFFFPELYSIFASRLGVGVTEAVILTVTNTLVGDYFEIDERRKWLTVQGVVGPIFATTVIALSGLLTGWAWNGAFLIYFAAFPVFAAMVLFVYEPAIKATAGRSSLEQAGERFPWRSALWCAAVTLCTAVLYYAFIVQGGLAYSSIGVSSPQQLGVLIAIASVGVPIGALAFGLLSKRFPIHRLIGVFLGLIGSGMIGMGLSRNSSMMTVFAFIQQIGAGMSVVTLIYWITRFIPAAHRGRGMGMWVCSFFAGQFLSPLVFSAAQAVAGSVLNAFLLVGAAGALAGLLLGFVRPRSVFLDRAG